MATIDSLDLVFRPDSRAPLELVFGDQSDAAVPEYEISGGGQISGLRRASAAMAYDFNVSRPALALRSNRYQEARPIAPVRRSAWQDASRTALVIRSGIEPGQPLSNVQRSAWQQADQLSRAVRSVDEPGQPLAAGARGRFQQAIELSGATRSAFQTGVRISVSMRGRFEEVIRLWPVLRSGFELGVHRILAAHDDMQPGVLTLVVHRQRFQQGRYPPPGASRRPVVRPTPDWCYVPTDPIELVFRTDDRAPLELLFECERHGGGQEPEQPGALIVVPSRDVYMTLNNVTLKRLSDGLILPAQGIELTLDADSFTWGWSAAFAGAEEVALVETALAPDTGDPVEVELTINGQAIRLLTDPISRERRFARRSLRVPGRGLAAELDAPSAPQMVFSQAADRTAAQLAEEALQVNGVGIGWGVDWQLTDWYVPGGAWSHQGTHISALLEIAAAAGGYVQPHMTSRTLRILPRYPAAPWVWPELDPDIELPADPVSVEGIEWVRMPAYNRVYVFQEGGSVRGRVTREGTDGATEAPQITHPLITAGEAVLQAGTAALSATGKQAMVSLRLPVLEETGLILPGKLVRYVDGSKTRLGLVRSTSVSWERPVLRQTIKLETHILEAV